MRLGATEEHYQQQLQHLRTNYPDKHPLEYFSFSIIPDEIEFTRAYSLGMIRKQDLVVGKYYRGSCRNADVAKWNGSKFEYMRYKCGCHFKDEVSYPSDEDYFDVFIAWQMISPSETQIVK